MMHHIGVLKDMMAQLTPMDTLTESYLNEVARIGKKEEKFIISDLDDTLFSREEQLEKEELLRENRGEEGSKIIKYHLGTPYFIQNYYIGKDFPQTIISQMAPKKSLILTAGFDCVQSEKIKALGLDAFPFKIVKKAEDKILATLQHILYSVRYVPSEIYIYEDRPRYFLEYKELIEGILGCTLHVIFVAMDGNRGYKKLEEIK